MPLCHFDKKNVWILKPTGLNRGKGIHVVDQISEVKKIIKQTCLENRQLKAQTPILKPGKDQKGSGPSDDQMKTFVIQKYVERPFLMNGRKFDMRVWVLLTQDMDLYFFSEGYLRLTSSVYNL